MGDCVIITMFHKFSFSYHEREIDSETMKSEKLVKLFAYLLSHYQRTVPSSELVDVLWYLDDVDNPIGALKNLIYRLRTLLKKEFGLTDFIITGKGSYSINPNYHLQIDTVIFEKYEALLKTSQKPEYYEHLLESYTGKYLMEIKEDHSVLSKRVYYHSLFMDKTIEYAMLLEEQKEYEKWKELLVKLSLLIILKNVFMKFLFVLYTSRNNIKKQKTHIKQQQIYFIRHWV